MQHPVFRKSRTLTNVRDPYNLTLNPGSIYLKPPNPTAPPAPLSDGMRECGSLARKEEERTRAKPHSKKSRNVSVCSVKKYGTECESRSQPYLPLCFFGALYLSIFHVAHGQVFMGKTTLTYMRRRAVRSFFLYGNPLLKASLAVRRLLYSQARTYSHTLHSHVINK